VERVEKRRRLLVLEERLLVRPLSLPDLLHTRRDDVFNAQLRSGRRKAKTENGSDFVSGAEDVVEVGFGVGGGETEADTR
jgi:hypothetical protein